MIERLAAIVTTGEPRRVLELAELCRATADRGGEVRVFFRDESIPLLCRPEARARLGLAPLAEDVGIAVAQALAALAARGGVELHACSSSLYLWGVGAGDLIPAVAGARGLIAFLADDLEGATEVRTA